MLVPCMVTSTLKVLSKFSPTLDSSYLDHQSKTEGANKNERGLQRAIVLRAGGGSTQVAGIRKGFSQGDSSPHSPLQKGDGDTCGR